MSAMILSMVASWLLLSLPTGSGAEVPAMFVFGDSLADPGNNNRLVTLARADYYPNGIDFPTGATGRFCNGGTTADHLANLLGLPLIPPFNNPSTKGLNLLQGVNFASAAAGILNETGRIFGNNFSMDQQVQNFKITMQELIRVLGKGTSEFLGRSLFFVCMGSNDYISDYLLAFSLKPLEYSPDAYSELLIQEYTRQLKDLYELGARKFLIGGIPPLGCIPNQIAKSDTDACVDSTNSMVRQFNTKLKKVLFEYNSDLNGSYFLYWDTFNFTYNIILNPSRHGFKYADKACCGTGRLKGKFICLPELPLQCHNRSEYVFWDPYHTTDAFNAIIAKDAYQVTLKHTFPMNVKQCLDAKRQNC